jgi:hypothetical protein
MIKSTTVMTVRNGALEQRIIAVGKVFRVADDARLKHYRGRIVTITDFNALLPTRVRIMFENGQRGAMRVDDLGEEIVSYDEAEMAAT